MNLKYIIKQVDWKTKKVEWKLIRLPVNIYVKDFIKEVEVTGWEVIAFATWIDGTPALYLERGVE